MKPTAKRPSGATVIVSTYENPTALALVFAGLARQIRTDFEVLVADDGSREPARAVVSELARSVAVPVRHVWQPDQGLRKGRILNHALLEAGGDYVIFLDGDIVPAPDFVASHLALARPDAYLSGSTVLLGTGPSARLTPDDVARGSLDGLRSWRPGNRRSRRVAMRRVPGLAALFDRRLARRPVGFHGGNASVTRDAALAIGGFDERLARFEDKDFGYRLRLHGLRGESVRYRIPTWHVHHERPYAGRKVRDDSRALFEASVSAGKARTEHGLQLLASYDHDTDADTGPR
jgi:glycosyltransferase involved in cell wall biosynthesis